MFASSTPTQSQSQGQGQGHSGATATTTAISFIFRDIYDGYLADLHMRPSPEIDAQFMGWMGPAFHKGDLRLQGARIGMRTCIAVAKLFSPTTNLAANASPTNPSNALMTVDVRNNRIKDQGCTAIAYAISHLTKRVLLDANDIGAAGAISLAKSLSNVTANHAADFVLDELSIAENGSIGPHPIALLFDAVSARSWDISGTGLKGEEEVVHALAASLASTYHTSCMEVLRARKCGFASPSALLIAKAMEINSTLRYIDLSQNLLGDDFCAALACAISTGGIRDLHTLNLADNRICGDGIIVLVRALLENRIRLRVLDLSGNIVGDDSAVAVSELHQVQEIRMERCGLSAVSAEAFAQAASRSTFGNDAWSPENSPNAGGSPVSPMTKRFDPSVSLSDSANRNGNSMSDMSSVSGKKLYISSNSIRDSGALALAQSASAFAHISMNDCSISDQGALALILSSRSSLSLKSNHISPQGGRLVAREILRNPSILQLDLRGNSIDHSSMNVISKHCEDNRKRVNSRLPRKLEREVARLQFVGEKLIASRDELTRVRRERQNEESRIADDEDTMRVLRSDHETYARQVRETVAAEAKRVHALEDRIKEKEIEKQRMLEEIQRDVEKLERRLDEESKLRQAAELDYAERFDKPVKIDLKSELEAELSALNKQATEIEQRTLSLQNDLVKARKDKDDMQMALLNKASNPGKPASKPSTPASGSKPAAAKPPAPGKAAASSSGKSSAGSKPAAASAGTSKTSTAAPPADNKGSTNTKESPRGPASSKPTPGMYPSTRESSSSSLTKGQ